MAATKLGWAWAAGLFEGEGCIGLTKVKGRSSKTGKPITYYYYPRLSMSLTDLDTLERFVSVVGGKIRGPYPPPKGKRKPVAFWHVDTDHAEEIIGKFYPYLGKRRQAKAREVFGEDL